MTLAKLARSFTRLRRIQPQIGRLQAVALRLSGGRIRRSRLLAFGQPVLVLETSGRRSGARRSTTLAYLRDGEAYAVSALNMGSDRDPAWCLNLRADPRAHVHVGGERKAVRAREARGEEADRLWRALIERVPATGRFRELARREVPVIVLEVEPAAPTGS